MTDFEYLLEQCNLTGGRHNSAAMSAFLILPASSSYFKKRREETFYTKQKAQFRRKKCNLKFENSQICL